MTRQLTASNDYSVEKAVELLRSQGRTVVRSTSGWWYNAYGQKHIYYSFPPNRIVELKKDEAREVFRGCPGAKALRFLAPDLSVGRTSYLWTCRAPYTLETIKPKARNQVRQGLKNCQVKQLSLGELELQGQKAHSDSMRRFSIDSGKVRFGDAMKASRLYEAWGAYVQDELAAYIVTYQVEDWVFVQIHRSANEFLKYRPNNALIFTVFQQLLARDNVSTVSYGWEPLYDLDSLDSFKLSMGSVKAPCKQTVVLAPWLRPAVPKFVCKAVEAISRRRSENNKLRWVAGLCRLIRESIQ